MFPCVKSFSVRTRMSSGSSSPTSPGRPVFSSARAATPRAAEGARHEAVRARADVRVELGPVHLEEARVLVELVLDGVGGDDLHVHRDLPRGVGADGDAVPRVRREEEVERRPARFGGHSRGLYRRRRGLPRRPRLGQNGSMRSARDVHVVAAEAGSERAAELLPALRAAGPRRSRPRPSARRPPRTRGTRSGSGRRSPSSPGRCAPRWPTAGCSSWPTSAPRSRCPR